MLVNNSVIKKIDDTIDKAFLGFTFLLIGDDFLTDEQKRQVEAMGLIVGRKPLVELIYTLVRNRPTEGYKKDSTVQNLLDSLALAGILPIINDAQQYSLDHAKASMAEAIEVSKKELKKRVKKEVLQANKEFHHVVNSKRYGSIQAQKKKEKDHMADLLTAIAVIAPAVHSAFSREFTTNLTNLINDATVDALSTASLMTGIDPKDISVFKKTVNDSKTCNWCDKLYNNPDGTPRIYKLSELQENGVNDPSDKASWQAVIGATHPRCRCQLRYLKG